MNKFLCLLFVSAMFACAFADSEESDDVDLSLSVSKPAAFIEKHLANESEDVKADVIEGIRNFQDFNLTGFKAHFDKWPAHVQKLFQ
ncbi:hypothetical protein PMAYCL1PPCAC_13047, partial [Pristionchus mayeri]